MCHRTGLLTFLPEAEILTWQLATRTVATQAATESAATSFIRCVPICSAFLPEAEVLGTGKPDSCDPSRVRAESDRHSPQSVHDVKIVSVCCLGIFGMWLRSSEHLLEGGVRVPSRPLDQIVQQRHGADSRESPSGELRQDVSA